MSVVERARIVRIPNEIQLERALIGLLESPIGRGGPGALRGPGRLRIARRRRGHEPVAVQAAVPPPLQTPAPADDGPDEGAAAAVGNP